MNGEQSLTRTPATAPERIEQRPVLAPAVDVYENKDEILVLADVPGAQKDGVEIRLEKNELRLRAARGDVTKGEPVHGRVLRGDWARTFVVPSGIDAEKITAALKDGTLTIRLPKSEAVKPRQIAVRAG